MIFPPAPPTNLSAPLVNKTLRGRAVREPFLPKIHGEFATNPWIRPVCMPNLLFVESFFCRVGSIYPPVWRFLPRIWPFFPQAVFFTLAILSLFNYLKREREIGPKKGKTPLTLIHGFFALTKKSSTGQSPFHGFFRGNPWIYILFFINQIYIKKGAIHVSTGCAAPGLPRVIDFEGLSIYE